MTVTNIGTIAARNRKLDVKALTAVPGQNFIALRKRRAKFSDKNIVLPSSLRRLLEDSPSEGEQRHRAAAQDRDLYVMVKLGLRLLTGDCLPKSIEEGIGWPKHSTELRNPFGRTKQAGDQDPTQQKPDMESEVGGFSPSFQNSCLLKALF